jgi:hypothetical protein
LPILLDDLSEHVGHFFPTSLIHEATIAQANAPSKSGTFLVLFEH